MKRVVVLSGAGLSAESGIATFRDVGGIWSEVNLEDVATPEAFARDPETVQAFYNARRAQMASCAPNPAHAALARLQRETPGHVALVTQNIDDLLTQAGAGDVIHMHGRLRSVVCASCDDRHDTTGELRVDMECAKCGAIGTLRPDVVWFGEFPYRMDAIEMLLARCDLFISVGTSGTVYPAAGFVQMARMAGAYTVELNLEPSEGASLFQEHHHGPASVIVPAFVEALLAAQADP